MNDVLDLSRLEAKMMKFQILDCEMREICNDLIYMARRDSEGHIHAELESDVEHQMIRMDANRFNQAVLSMLIYPVANDTDREVKMQLARDEKTNYYYSISPTVRWLIRLLLPRKFPYDSKSTNCCLSTSAVASW